MNAMWLRIIASLIPLIFAMMHLIFPKITIDMTTISLLLLSFVPWILPLLKSLELPGGIKIELQDVKNITDKVTEPQHLVPKKDIEVESKITGKGAISSEVNVVSNDPISIIKRVAGTDPNLALVGFRIEIEKRIIAIGEKIGIETYRVPLYKLLKEFQKRELLNSPTINALMELIAVGNQAAHGAKVSNDAANWVLDVGPIILLKLDNEVQNIGS